MNKNILKVFTAGLLAFSLAGCGSKSDSKTITVGATTSPHAIILKHVQPEFEKAGYKNEDRDKVSGICCISDFFSTGNGTSGRCSGTCN